MVTGKLSLERRGDLAIRGTFAAHLPNFINNGRIEPRDTQCDRHLGRFRFSALSKSTVSPCDSPGLQQRAAKQRGTTVQSAQDARCWVPEYSGLKRRVCPTFPADVFSVVQGQSGTDFLPQAELFT